MSTKLVVKFMDGRVKKGNSDDFLFLRDTFHFRQEVSDADRLEEISISDLKAVFFVGDYVGDASYNENKKSKRPTYNHRVSIRFPDGEEIVGYTDDDLVRTEVIRLVPADPLSNNTLIFVVKENTVSIQSMEG